VSPEPIAGDVHFNETFEWGVSDPSRYDVFTIMLHEAGHSLGLMHSSDPDAVMYPMYRGIVTGLAQGDIDTAHQLYAAPPSVLPAGWNSTAIGSDVAGSVSATGGTFTIQASGRDVWDTADELRFVWRRLDGDGDMIARVDSLAGVHRWTKAGVMIRGSSAPGAPHAFMLVSSDKGLAFQRRKAADGLTVGSEARAGRAPHWLWLSRRGDRFEAYAAADGATWQLVGADTIAMGQSVLAGLALTSHDAAAVATAQFSSVSLTSQARWENADIGAVGVAGSLTQTATEMRVKGAGEDIWGTADAFQFVWRPLSGNGEIIARVASVQNVNRWSKAGVMIRGSRDPGAPHALMLASPGKGFAFQRRVTRDGVSTHTSGGAGTAPHWLKLRRTGSTLTASTSPDGVTWTTVATDTIPMAPDVLIGLAVSSHTATASCLAVFDNVTVRRLK
jgi:regulation of enolase protein 1 (concanavalin A-like superfamily)